MCLLFNQKLLIIFLVFITVYSYDYSDTCSASQSPPGGLSIAQAPMFVVFGFDDNGYSGLDPTVNDGGVTWVNDFFSSHKNPPGAGNSGTFDGEQCKVSFYFTTQYIHTWTGSAGLNKKSWRAAMDNGHEVGNHTHDHLDGISFTVAQWEEQMQICQDWLKKPYDPNESVTGNTANGIGAQGSDIVGFRSPYLNYNNNTFIAEKNMGFQYDCSIEEGWQDPHDGTNYNWPYTLHKGSPGHTYLFNNGKKDFEIDNHAGLWEMPCYPIIIPPDDKCNEYGVAPGLRVKLHAVFNQIELSSGKIRGLDYDMFVEAGMTKEEALACLKYTFDLRYTGNRCPMLFGTHSDKYATNAEGWEAPNATVQECRQTIEEFVTYILTKDEVRIVSARQLVEWMRDPVPLEGTVTQNKSISLNDNLTIYVKRNYIAFYNCFCNKNTVVKLYSLHGRCISSGKAVINGGGKYIWHFKNPLACGTYLLQISTEGECVFKRVSLL